MLTFLQPVSFKQQMVLSIFIQRELYGVSALFDLKLQKRKQEIKMIEEIHSM